MKEFADNEGARNFTLIDARMPDAFNAGHVPGAINIPAGKFMANTDLKTLKTPAERQQVFEEAGVDLSKDIAFSCQAGVAACYGYSSAKDIAKGKVMVYDGSWSEYGTRSTQ